MQVRVLGRHPDGTLSVCRAKPENWGRPPCTHTDHVESDATDEVVRRYNSEELSRQLGAVATRTRRRVRRKPSRSQAPKEEKFSVGGSQVSREELDHISTSVSEQFKQEDYSFIDDFYRRYGERVSDPELRKVYARASDNIYDFLRSDDPVAVQAREFLGMKPQEMKVFSQILVSSVGVMTRAEEWHNDGQRHSASRVVLTSLRNDMDKRRYVASVMFFGGRCCYCHRPFWRPGDGIGAPSGEHITPLNPSSPPPGTTRYGNMALACIACNKSRGNKDLEKWVRSSGRVPEDQKETVLERISAFRRYAMYTELDERQRKVADKAISNVRSFVSEFAVDEDGKVSARSAERIKAFIDAEIMKARRQM